MVAAGSCAQALISESEEQPGQLGAGRWVRRAGTEGLARVEGAAWKAWLASGALETGLILRTKDHQPNAKERSVCEEQGKRCCAKSRESGAEGAGSSGVGATENTALPGASLPAPLLRGLPRLGPNGATSGFGFFK